MLRCTLLLILLEEISESCEVKSDVRAAEKGHLSMIAESKFFFFLCFWEKVLGIANVVSKYFCRPVSMNRRGRLRLAG